MYCEINLHINNKMVSLIKNADRPVVATNALNRSALLLHFALELAAGVTGGAGI